MINGTTDVRLYASKDNGKTWGLLAYATTGATINGLAIACAGNIVHYLATNGTAVLYGKIDADTASGQDIASSATILETQAYVGACSLEIAPDGHLHAAWGCKSDTTNPNSCNLRYSESTDNGSGWNTAWVTALDTSGSDWTQPCIVVKQDNNPVIFACLSSPTSKAIKCFVNNGAAWGAETTVYDGGTYDQANPCAVVSSDNKLHVVWEGTDATYTAAADIRYRNSVDGVSWTNPVVLLTTGNTYAQSGATIAADGGSNLCVLWSGRASGTYIMYMENTSNSQEGEYVFSDNQGYHYVYSERGTESMHKTTDDLFEISYWVLDSIITSMAFDYELRHRIPNQDCRRIAFEKRLELLDYIGSNYRKRGEIEVDQILKANPYHDKI